MDTERIDGERTTGKAVAASVDIRSLIVEICPFLAAAAAVIATRLPVLEPLCALLAVSAVAVSLAAVFSGGRSRG